MSRLIHRITDRKMSRRDFLKGSLVATATVTGLSLAGCSSTDLKESSTASTTAAATTEGAASTAAATTAEATTEAAAEHAPVVDLEQGGEWKNAACWHNCGGRCVNKVYVVDGMVIRQKTDDTHEDTPDYPQQRSCIRGHSQQQQCFGADRLKYPMKRKHWEPHTGGDKSLRGRDEWERISWEDALDLVAEELRYAKETYGNRSILYPSWGIVLYGDMPKLLGMEAMGGFGGYTEVADTASFGSFGYNINVMGLPTMAGGNAVDRLTMRKSDTIVLYGCNPAWSSAGNPAYHYLQAKKAGAEYVFVGPEYNVTASMLDARWIRVRPGTDTAFLLAVAYEMLQLEESKGDIIDWDQLNRCSVGFDAEHMPEDATLNENFKDYVLGAYDDQPKTAEWASEITGTPVEDIRWYAEKMGMKNKVCILHSFAAARCNNAEDFPQLFYTIGMMGGHWGKEGHACGNCYHTASGNNAGNMVVSGLPGQPTIVPNEPNPDCFKGPELWQGILDGRYNYTGNYLMGSGVDMPSEEREIDIQVIIHEHHNFLQSQMGLMKGIEAHRKVGFVMTQSSWLNTSARYSDIVLPVTTLWEREDALGFNLVSNAEMRVFPEKVVDPLYEAKDDLWIIRELATRLGLSADAIVPMSDTQTRYNCLASATACGPDGTMTPIATITEKDIKDWGVEGTPQEGLMPLDDFIKQGVYQIPRKEGDGYQYIGWKAFVDDPAANPLPSKSGKFEIYCEEKANIVNNMKRSTVKPYPTYVRPLKGYEESFSDWENKVKGEYPYQITNPHYLRRAHTTLDNLPWLRETMPNPVWINASDAKEKGIKEGDTVLIYNEFGKTLRPASLTERLMPGVLAMPHGAAVELDEETGIDKAGADNVLCGPICSGIGTSGYNTTLVNFEKYDGPALEPDWTWPARVIEF
ncbi:MAG: molybdopterin-dependent oxidoreductase [Lachnospiraceae bacterium]|nr:molybdopterin-dependent oxidoreductase [Lachnospiraceae bacterium]